MLSAKLERHLARDRYDGFVLTDAIRPSPRLEVIPREGYRVGLFRNPSTGRSIPMLVAAASRDKLFSLFLDLAEPLGPVVDVVLETSHHSINGDHEDRCRDQIDLPVLLSQLCDHEDMLLNDGCTGVAILSEEGPAEVQFDEHKLLTVYANDLRPFESVLQAWGLSRDDDMRFITDAEHLHSTLERYAEEFDQLAYQLGVEEAVEPVNW